MPLLQTAESVAAEVKARVAQCTVANGYETDIGTRVFQGRRVIDDDLIPCTVILEADDRVLGQQGLNVEVDQPFVLYAYVACDPADPNLAAHAALRDLKRAVFTTNGRPSWNWQGKVTQLNYQGKDIGPRTDGASFVLAVLAVGVQYVERLAGP